MTYEEAKKIALSKNAKVNTCHEYNNGYHFFEMSDKEVDGDNGMVILKDTGRALRWISFILDYHPEKNYKEIKEF